MDRPDHAWILSQTEVWVDASGGRHRIQDMGLRYCQNVHAFLLRNAGTIADGIYAELMRGPEPMGDAASDAFDMMTGELEEAITNPIPWIRRWPFIEALEERIESFGAAPEKERTVTVVLRLKVPHGKGRDVVERSVDKVMKLLPYDWEITSITD